MQPAAGVYEGKAKRVFPRNNGEVAIYYKDDATAFNGQKHEVFPGKGELNSQISELLMVFIEKEGIPTHHLRREDNRTLIARQLRMLALEVVVRFRVAGSLQKRTGLRENTPCEPPVVELYYKRDDLGDPIVNDDHVRLLGLATPSDLAQIRDMSLRAATKLVRLLERGGIALVDLKLEFGRADDGRILLADEISPDTCRFRDAKSGLILDKDRFRRGEGDLLEGYRELYERLQKALRASSAGERN